jgi:hypothetical protein
MLSDQFAGEERRRAVSCCVGYDISQCSQDWPAYNGAGLDSAESNESKYDRTLGVFLLVP